MPVEIHLPDLPDLPISLGASSDRPPRPRLPWHLRLRDLVAAYLPLLLMLLLAIFTWWLVKNTPATPVARGAAPVRHEPDYTMNRFVLDRFDAGGRFKARIEGDEMRHFPDTDRIEIDAVQMRTVDANGRITLATARRAISNGDGSEVQLLGDAQITSEDVGGPIVMNGEFLHLFLVTEQVRSHLPVMVRRNGADLRAGGFTYDNVSKRLDLRPPVRALLPPARPRSGASTAP